MNVKPLKTHRISRADTTLLKLLDQYVPPLRERAILVITSKIVSITQGRVVAMDGAERSELIKAEAEAWLPATSSRYAVMLTIKENLLIPNAGVDESNGDGCYVLWPQDVQDVANRVRAHLQQRDNLEFVGVLITDSRPAPLRWGVTGAGIAHSGFVAVNDQVGQLDLFGRTLRMTRVNVLDGLAAAAVLVMGEGAEQTPLAVIEDLPFVQFQARDPSDEELASARIGLEDDLYAPLLTAVAWQTGNKS